MKEFKYYALFLSCLIVYLGYGQEIKNYSGKFEEGTATYQYYENSEIDRIFHGPFSYNGSLYEMNGKYAHGKKIGKWNIVANNKLFSGWRGSIYLNTKINGVYVNGMLDGDWSYSNSIQFANDNKEDKEVSSAIFLDNHFIGKFTYQSSWPLKYSVTGQFDSLGFMVGTWIYTEDMYRDEIRFLDGIAYWRLFSNVTNGEKRVFCDSSEFVKKVLRVFDSSKGIAVIDGKTYYLDTVDISESNRVSSNSVIEIEDPYHTSFGTTNPISLWVDDRISVYESGAISNPLYYYSKGSVPPYGFQLVIKECDYYSDCYRRIKEIQDKEDELKRIALQKEIIEKRETEAKIRNEKIMALTNRGDILYSDKKYKAALVEYDSAWHSSKSDSIIERIRMTKREISRIDSLQKLRSYVYEQLKSQYENISSDAVILEQSLEKRKKIYSKNYHNCIVYLSANLPSLFDKIKTFYTNGNTTGFSIEDTWQNSDQVSLDLLWRMNDELNAYQRFYDAVKKAFDSDNKAFLDKLKISEDPKEVISVF